ncbi:MAG: lipid-A-disaccharide synthase [Saprospiraceae bacterium]|nr:lipid-A-disaccharide synthase [Saprospiraceae bacterium]
MKLYIIAGEASGDLHGAALMSAITAKASSIHFRYWGGNEMKKISGTPVKHIRDLSFMGFTEVIRHLPTILGNFRFAKRDIEEYRPDALILIDYPGFNLRMAKWARKKGYKVIYYISPQLWAWNQSRAEKIRKYVDLMLVILPFEKRFYEDRQINAHYVGHPLAERLIDLPSDPGFRTRNELDGRKIIALLPGSRKQEIAAMLPTMLRSQWPEEYQCVIAAAPSQDKEFYQNYLKGLKDIRIIFGQTYQVLKHAHAAIVTSGTATLETGLLKVPQVVCYKGSWLSYNIARRLIKVKYISLVNLILNRSLVPELIQSDFNAGNLTKNLEDILEGPKRQTILKGYMELHEKLSDKKASESAAQLILDHIQSNA